MLTAAHRQMVIDKLKGCIAKAEAHYKMKFAMPTITYDLTGGRTAGMARFAAWQIRLNPAIMLENLGDYLARTVPHELGHLIDQQVYTRAPRGLMVTSTGRVRREKRDVHGPSWQEACRVIGMTDITRCHSYETQHLKRITARTRTIPYKCSRCGHPITLSQKHVEQLRADPFARWHKGCKGFKLIPADASAQPAPAPRPAPVYSTPAPARTAAPVNVGGTYATKMDHCRALFNANRGASRQAIIALFVGKANCTPAGAATYYATLNKH